MHCRKTRANDSRFLLDFSRCDNMNQHRGILVQYIWLYSTLNRCIDSCCVIWNVCVLCSTVKRIFALRCMIYCGHMSWSSDQYRTTGTISIPDILWIVILWNLRIQIDANNQFQLARYKLLLLQSTQSFDAKDSTFCVRFYSA